MVRSRPHNVQLRRMRDQVDTVCVVDNGSTADDLAVVRRLADPKTTFIENRANLGHTGGCHRGVQQAVADGCDAVFVMNNDTA
jgi:GT2 family glycosyltransferase